MVSWMVSNNTEFDEAMTAARVAGGGTAIILESGVYDRGMRVASGVTIRGSIWCDPCLIVTPNPRPAHETWEPRVVWPPKRDFDAAHWLINTDGTVEQLRPIS